MTEFWTILVITYSGALLGGDVSYVALPSHSACVAAMDVIYEELYPHMPELMLQCIDTDTMSSSIRPKARPEGIGEK